MCHWIEPRRYGRASRTIGWHNACIKPCRTVTLWMPHAKILLLENRAPADPAGRFFLFRSLIHGLGHSRPTGGTDRQGFASVGGAKRIDGGDAAFGRRLAAHRDGRAGRSPEAEEGRPHRPA